MKLSTEQISLLNEYIEKGFLIVNRHPKYPITLYKYSKGWELHLFGLSYGDLQENASTEELQTRKTYMLNTWTDLMKICRGLVLDDNYNIIAYPFKKFFNIEDYNYAYPKEQFTIYEKVDGSCIIAFKYNNIIIATTLGSFESDQAQYATVLLNTKYKDYINQFEDGKTYIFELIYPENRIVVDYGDRKELIFLGCVDTETGSEIDNIKLDGFTSVGKIDNITIDELIDNKHKLKYDNKEGFVVKFKSGLRMKVKFDEYFIIHHMISNLSEKSVWKGLVNNTLDTLIVDSLPDEFIEEYERILNDFKHKYNEYKDYITKIYESYKHLAIKDYAIYVNEHYKSDSSLLFALYRGFDEKQYAVNIWKRLKPKNEKNIIQLDDDE